MVRAQPFLPPLLSRTMKTPFAAAIACNLILIAPSLVTAVSFSAGWGVGATVRE